MKIDTQLRIDGGRIEALFEGEWEQIVSVNTPTWTTNDPDYEKGPKLRTLAESLLPVFAAAPEMLEALELAVKGLLAADKELGGNVDLQMAAETGRAAIRKATGAEKEGKG